jgi:hypothetical protein
VICEILAHTPIFKDFDYKTLKAVFVPVKTNESEIKNKVEKAEKELNTHFPFISKLLKVEILFFGHPLTLTLLECQIAKFGETIKGERLWYLRDRGK